jgi:hypothetical protein
MTSWSTPVVPVSPTPTSSRTHNMTGILGKHRSFWRRAARPRTTISIRCPRNVHVDVRIAGGAAVRAASPQLGKCLRLKAKVSVAYHHSKVWKRPSLSRYLGTNPTWVKPPIRSRRTHLDVCRAMSLGARQRVSRLAGSRCAAPARRCQRRRMPVRASQRLKHQGIVARRKSRPMLDCARNA